MSSSRSSRLDEQVDYQGLAGARRHGSPAQLGFDFCERTPGRHLMQQTAGCHTCMRPVTCGDPGDGPKADRVSWPIVSIPDVGDGVSWRSADFSAQSRGAPRWVAGSPGVWLSVTPCPAIIARPGWPAVVTPPSAPRSLMGRGQVQAYGTCPLQNEHESAPDLVRRIRQSARHQESGWRADHWMRRTSRIGPNASSCSTSGHGVVSRQRPRGARPSMPDRLLYRRG